jgi:5-methylcytosine-specific restriction endonuclease McrA
MRICSGAGCLRTVAEDVKFCPDCKPSATADGDGIRAHVPEGAERSGLKLTGAPRALRDPMEAEYQTKRCREGIRPRVSQRDPYCVDCKRKPSEVADHEIPARLIVAAFKAERISPFEKYPGFYVLENLRGRCHGCHNSKTKIEDAQDWTAQLDALLAKFRKKAV